MSGVTDELAGDATAVSGPGAVPPLARHSFRLSSGHRVGLIVSGRGVPLVVVHGFTAEGFLYAQTLQRLVATGFKVIAIDMAGHGGTQGLPLSGGRLGDYAALMGQVIDELGIRRSVLAGHSMGGRVMAQLAAQHPEQTVAVLLIDAIVGDQWDAMVNLFRVAPWLLVPMGAALLIDSVSTLPVVRDPRQAAQIGQLLTPILVNHATHPWRLIGPAASILRTRGEPRHPRGAGPGPGPHLRAARRPRPDRAPRHRPLRCPPIRRAAHHRQGGGALLDAARPRDPAGHRGRAVRTDGWGRPSGRPSAGPAPPPWTSWRPSSTSPTPPSTPCPCPPRRRPASAPCTAPPATAGPRPDRTPSETGHLRTRIPEPSMPRTAPHRTDSGSGGPADSVDPP